MYLDLMDRYFETGRNNQRHELSNRCKLFKRSGNWRANRVAGFKREIIDKAVLIYFRRLLVQLVEKQIH